MKKDFIIDNIDPLGQGVSKVNDSIIFIKKTLPGEIGITEIISNKKGVSFGKLSDLSKKSTDRITPQCPHFNQCNGCDFLHTSYQKEIEFKLINIKRSLSYLGNENVTFHSAPDRFNYRNRIQLHYNKKQNRLGFLDSQHNIIKIENCIIGTKAIQTKLSEMMNLDSWKGLVLREPVEGHIELYEKNGKVEVAINQNYAHGGFTQVNEAMNEKLKALITQKIKERALPGDVIFDLFGGNGNLTKDITNPTLVVDYYERTPENKFHQIFFHQDLYKEKAIVNIQKFFSKRPNLIVFDPPRSGLKNLVEYVTAFSPDKFISINCLFSSFTRDTKSVLEHYILEEVHIVDLFPGTHHFETIGIFTKRM